MTDGPLGDEFPRAMFKDGGDVLIDGRPVREIAVRDAAEQDEKRLEGWRVNPASDPLDHDLNGEPGGSLPRRGRPPKPRD